MNGLGTFGHGVTAMFSASDEKFEVRLVNIWLRDRTLPTRSEVNPGECR